MKMHNLPLKAQLWAAFQPPLRSPSGRHTNAKWPPRIKNAAAFSSSLRVQSSISPAYPFRGSAPGAIARAMP